MTKKSGVYLLTKGRVEGEAAAYVGESSNFNARWPAEVKATLGAWVDVPGGYKDRHAVEVEAIEFCQAFGLPLVNVQHNGGYIKHGRQDPKQA